MNRRLPKSGMNAFPRGDTGSGAGKFGLVGQFKGLWLGAALKY